MGRWGWIAGSVLGVAMMMGQARAQDADTTADVRCLVVSVSMVASQQQNQQTAGLMSALYFLGRLDGRRPDLDLENRLVDEVTKLKPEQLREEAVRCGALLKERGKALTDMGARISQRGHEMQRHDEQKN